MHACVDSSVQARVRREQKKLKEDMERLADTTAEHLRLAQRRPSSTTSEDDWQGAASKRTTAVREAADSPVAMISARVDSLETAFHDFSPAKLVGQLETSRKQIDQLAAELQVVQRVQKGDSSMVRHFCCSIHGFVVTVHLKCRCRALFQVRALRLLQKLMSQPDPTAVFAEFDTDGDKQVSLCLACFSLRKFVNQG